MATSSVPRVAAAVHVTGLERSGKTTMAAFLDAHPQIAVPAVGTNMWLYFADRFGSLEDPENLRRCLDAMMSYDRVRWLRPNRDSIERQFESKPKTYGRLFDLFLMQYAERMSKQIWGSQSAWLDRHLDALLDAEPNSRVIHMIRDPRDRFAAVKAHWPDGRGQAGAAAAKWNTAFGLSRTHQQHRDEYMVVRFEDLVAQPEEVLGGVCEFLGVGFDRVMLGAVKAKKGGEPDLDGPPLVERLSESYLGTFRQDLTPEEVAFIQTRTDRGRRRLRYESDPPTMSALERAWFWATYWPQQLLRGLLWKAVDARSRLAPARYGAPIDPEYLVEDVRAS